MSTVTLYKGKNSPHYVAAHEQGVRGVLGMTALRIGLNASALLATHHGNTPFRKHDLPPPRITVEMGKLDFYVLLEAEDRSEGLALARAIGIEFGHKYQSRSKNPSGPWGRSGGLHILQRALDAA